MNIIQIIDKLNQFKQNKQILRKSCKNNGIKANIIADLSISKLKIFHQKIKKTYANSSLKTDFWGQNELKTFNWILIIISSLQNILIQQFTDKQWQTIENIFKNKTKIFLKYQAQRFIKEKNQKNKNWTQEQDRLLRKVVDEYQKIKISLNYKQYQKTYETNEKYENKDSFLQKSQSVIKNDDQNIKNNQQIIIGSHKTLSQNTIKESVQMSQKHQDIQEKDIISQNLLNKDRQDSQNGYHAQVQSNNKQKVQWNLVARKIYQYSQEKYFRSAKHCRQRWFNHVDPSKDRGKWTTEQDIALMQQIKRIGMRWSQLALKLNRTEHSVKNRYNSLINNMKRQKSIRVHKSLQEYQNQQNILSNQCDIPYKQENHDENEQYQIKVQEIQKQQSEISGMEDLKHIAMINQEIGNQTNTPNISFSPFLSYSPKIKGIITPIFGQPSPLGFSLGFASYQKLFTQNIKSQNQQKKI